MAMNRRFPPLPSVRDILRMYQITAKKSMSQNFILDPAILRKIAKAAGVLKEKYVIEVGPGPGGITRALLESGPKQVLVIEKDPRFIPSLQLLQEAAGGQSKLKINIGDCLHYNVEKLIPDSEIRHWDSPLIPDVRLVGNLPFNVATPFLIRLLSSMHSKNNLFAFGRVPSVLTFQHEVAHRMAAEPNDPERCRLSVICQNYAQVEYLFTLPGGAFVPRPEVDVGVVRLTPLRKPYISVSEDEPPSFEFVNKVITTLFHNKKKYIRTNLTKLFPEKDENYPWKMAKAILSLTGLDYDRTAISLSMQEIEQICIAYNHLCQENVETLNHVDPLIQSEIDATNRCLNWSEHLLPGSNVDNDESEKSIKFDIKF